MKKILIMSILSVLISFSYATPKKNLKDCETALKQCMQGKTIVSDTIIIYSGKEAVKIAKQVEKTKRKEAQVEQNIVKIEEKNQTNRNVFVNFRKLVSQNSWAFVLTALGGMFLGTPIGAVAKSFFGK